MFRVLSPYFVLLFLLTLNSACYFEIFQNYSRLIIFKCLVLEQYGNFNMSVYRGSLSLCVITTPNIFFLARGLGSLFSECLFWAIKLCFIVRLANFSTKSRSKRWLVWFLSTKFCLAKCWPVWRSSTKFCRPNYASRIVSIGFCWPKL